MENENFISIDNPSEIIGDSPGWLVHSGIALIAFVTLLVLAGSYFIRFPEKITSNGLVSSDLPPIELISPVEGYLDSILMSDDFKVEGNDVVFNIRTTTDARDLSLLINWMDDYRAIKDPRKVLNVQFPSNLQLGTIQDDYKELELTFNQFKKILKDNIVFVQMKNLDIEIGNIKALNNSIQRELDLFENELDIIELESKRNRELFGSGTISKVELERSERALLQQKQKQESFNNSILRNVIALDKLELKKLELKQERQNIVKEQQLTMARKIDKILSSAHSWRELSIVKSPISGRINFSRGITINKYVQQGQVLGHVDPNQNNGNYLSALYPAQNIGKVELGQRAIIKFDGYPYKEFGVVQSHVIHVAHIPEIINGQVTGYEVRFSLEDEIMTDFHINIPHRPNMTASIDVITKEKSIFERLFDQLLSSL